MWTNLEPSGRKKSVAQTSFCINEGFLRIWKKTWKFYSDFGSSTPRFPDFVRSYEYRRGPRIGDHIFRKYKMIEPHYTWWLVTKIFIGKNLVAAFVSSCLFHLLKPNFITGENQQDKLPFIVFIKNLFSYCPQKNHLHMTPQINTGNPPTKKNTIGRKSCHTLNPLFIYSNHTQ